MKKTHEKDESFELLCKHSKKTYNESPFQLIISDIRSILPKNGCEKIKKGIKYVEELKKLTYLQIENIKNGLIRIKN